VEYFDCNVTRFGRAGRDIGVDWLVCAGVVPASCRRLAPFYRIYLICASASFRNTLCYINTIHKNGARQADLA